MASSPSYHSGSPSTTVGVGGDLVGFDGGAIVVGVFQGGELSSSGRLLDDAMDGLLSAVIESKDMEGKKDSQVVVHTHGRIASSRVVLVGLGKRDDVDAERLRRAAGESARRVRALGVGVAGTTLHSDVPVSTQMAGEAISEGTMLGLYRFSVYRTPDEENPDKNIDSFVLLDDDETRRSELAQGVARGEHRAEGGNLARDLGNEPPNVLTPLALARRAQAIASEVGLTCRIIEGAELEAEGFRTLLGVGQGSVNPPAFIVLEHGADRDEAPLVFVGKGICFDSGGLSLKTGTGMMDMKLDMAGAAAVLGAMRAVGALKVPRKIVGLIAAAENMPSASAQRPGDVVTSLGGPTIEILNTDAEGRLALADALGFAKRLEPAGVIDLATLTGACVVALGAHTCGLFGRHDADTDGFIERIQASADAVSERVWRLPLWDDYDEQIKSDIADVKNIGSGGAGAITAAAFLKKFATGYPWVHLDIAGVMSYDGDKGYHIKGASGFGARLLTHLSESWTD